MIRLQSDAASRSGGIEMNDAVCPIAHPGRWRCEPRTALPESNPGVVAVERVFAMVHNRSPALRRERMPRGASEEREPVVHSPIILADLMVDAVDGQVRQNQAVCLSEGRTTAVGHRDAILQTASPNHARDGGRCDASAPRTRHGFRRGFPGLWSFRCRWRAAIAGRSRIDPARSVHCGHANHYIEILGSQGSIKL